jgi:prophage tail gpP-like protein
MPTTRTSVLQGREHVRQEPTCEDLFEQDGFSRVHRKDDASWRHGVERTDVYRRDSDGTFWMANFRVSTDGETHGLRDGEAEIVRCYPKQVTKTTYVLTPPDIEPDGVTL